MRRQPSRRALGVQAGAECVRPRTASGTGIDDLRHVVVANGKTKKMKLGKQDKGHGAEMRAFVEAVRRGGPWPIAWDGLRSLSLASLLAVRSPREGTPHEIPHG